MACIYDDGEDGYNVWSCGGNLHNDILVVYSRRRPIVIMAPLETDPLLPQGRSAPEISGYGFRNPSNFNDYPPQSEVMEEAGEFEGKDDAQALRDGGGFSPLRVLVVLFAIVVGLAMIITLLSPGTADRPQSPPQDDAPTIQARVNRILMENPLIGLATLMYLNSFNRADRTLRWS